MPIRPLRKFDRHELWEFLQTAKSACFIGIPCIIICFLILSKVEENSLYGAFGMLIGSIGLIIAAAGFSGYVGARMDNQTLRKGSQMRPGVYWEGSGGGWSLVYYWIVVPMALFGIIGIINSIRILFNILI